MKKLSRQYAVFEISVIFVVIVVVWGAAGANAGTVVGWDGGTFVKNEEAGFLINFGGRVFSDAAWVSVDEGLGAAYPEIKDGTEIRSARFAADGLVHHVVDFKLQLEFAGRLVGFRDAYMGLRKLPVVGTLRVGHQKEMFGLEQLMSLKRIPFMERSLTSALVPGRNLGVGLGKTVSDGRVSITGGLFRNSDGGSSYRGNRYNGTFRFTVAPVMDTDSGRVLHFGAAGSLRQAEPDPEDGTNKLRFSANPESNLAPVMIDTGLFEAGGAAHAALEIAAIWRNASVVGEYIQVRTDAAAAGDPVFQSMHVFASYFITGETRGYRGGVLQGIQPSSDFNGRGGTGAWEVALRYSSVDLNDGDVWGGEERNFTAAMNWYIAANTRFMIDYTYADVIGVGSAHVIQTRFQVVF